MDKSEFFPSLVPAAQREQLITAVEIGAGEPLALAAGLLSLVNRFAATGETDDLRASVAASVLYDLVQQGWSVAVTAGRIYALPPDTAVSAEEPHHQIKARIREGLQRASNRQLATPAVQDFRRSMERVRHFQGRPVSIQSLVDDGTELAELLHAAQSTDGAAAERQLAKVLRPRIQVCGPDDRCEHTGIALLDIWRYFRHTWSLEYNSVPGRTLRILIRNDARPCSPVIGIAMIASPAANLYSRDEWIGWRLDEVTKGLVSGEIDANNVVKVLLGTVDAAISDIRTDDLLTAAELVRPTEAVLFRLSQTAARAQARRKNDLTEADGETSERLVDIRSVDKDQIADSNWLALSETALFTKKRAEQLVPLLQARQHFDKLGFKKVPKAALYEALVTKQGRAAVSTALNELRKRKLATEVADISVCGAIPPYNDLLGGKLVALLMASEEVRSAYRSRYAGQVSEIASQVAGRAIIRSADLKLITTTSLYGIGTSQYNRLRLPAYSDLGLSEPVVWRELRASDGVTVTHLSKQTVELMRRLGISVYGRRRINSVFGEGSSPRTRQIREGLNLIGINDDRVLKHSVGRKVFACELYPGAIDDLTGFRKRKGSARAPSAKSISMAWLRRWIVARSARADVLGRLQACSPSAVAEALEARSLRGALEATAESEMIVGDEANGGVSFEFAAA